MHRGGLKKGPFWPSLKITLSPAILPQHTTPVARPQGDIRDLMQTARYGKKEFFGEQTVLGFVNINERKNLLRMRQGQ